MKSAAGNGPGCVKLDEQGLDMGCLGGLGNGGVEDNWFEIVVVAWEEFSGSYWELSKISPCSIYMRVT